MATTAILPIHAGKGRPVAATLKDSVDYIKNPNKTDLGEWVTAYAVDPLIADEEFLFSKNQYLATTGRSQGAKDVLAYHVRIAFKPGETDAETANRIGYDLAMKLTKGRNAFVCCTHTDRHHMHTHVVLNSTNLDCMGKFRNFKSSAFAIRKIADFLCIENGLSIVENPKPSKGKHYGRQQGDIKLPSGRDNLRNLIDENLIVGNSLTEFITKLKRAGVEIKHGKQFSFRPPGSERFFRQDSLGEDYSADAIRERLMGTRNVVRRRPVDEVFVPFVITRQTSFTLLIDIQKKIAEGKGAAYETWAKLYNLKQMARTLIYLKENGIDSYEELVEKSSSASGGFHKKSQRIREIETRQSEISELQKQIGTYSKTRDIYRAYIKSGRDQAFYDVHVTDIILHEATKRHFDKMGFGKNKKLPKMDALKQEWATLNSEKKTLYRDYHEQKDRRTNLVNAKVIVEGILNIGKDEAERIADRVQKRNHSHER
jgi:hypothetical protein